MQLKKNPKADLTKNSSLYFAIGLASVLFISWQAIEWKTYEKTGYGYEALNVEDEDDEEVPITEQLKTPPPPPPPPPAPEVIEIVEDEEEVETSEDTEENAEADGDKGEADEMSLSLAAMEDSVRDDVVALVDQVAVTYKELATLRDRRIVTIKRGSQPSVKTETRYQELRILLIEQMDGIILNTNRIEALLDELFTLNRHLSSLEGQLLRLAEKSGINRVRFFWSFSFWTCR